MLSGNLVLTTALPDVISRVLGLVVRPSPSSRVGIRKHFRFHNNKRNFLP